MVLLYHVRGNLLGDFAGEMANLITDDVVHSDRIWIILLELLVSPFHRTAQPPETRNPGSDASCIVVYLVKQHHEPDSGALSWREPSLLATHNLCSIVSRRFSPLRRVRTCKSRHHSVTEQRTKSPVQFEGWLVAVLRQVQLERFNDGYLLRSQRLRRRRVARRACSCS